VIVTIIIIIMIPIKCMYILLSLLVVSRAAPLDRKNYIVSFNESYPANEQLDERVDGVHEDKPLHISEPHDKDETIILAGTTAADSPPLPIADDETPMGDDEPGDDDSPMNDDEPPMEDDESPMEDDEPPMEDDESPMEDDEPPMEDDEPPMEDDEPGDDDSPMDDDKTFVPWHLDRMDQKKLPLDGQYMLSRDQSAGKGVNVCVSC
jgi:hypothetical protein